MIRTVNIIQASSSSSSLSPLSRRQRAASSSSTTTHDTPTTPADVGPRGLPERISVAIMKRSQDSIKDLDPFDPSVWSNHSGQHLSNDRSEFLPTWLQGAISTLDFRHPLRSLLPEETRDSVHDDAESPALGSLSDFDAGTEDSPFAFSAPTKASAPCVQTNTAYYSGFDRASLTQSYRLEAGAHEYSDIDSRGLQLHPERSPPLPLLHPSIGDYKPISSMLPFSTPGPVSDFDTYTLVPSRTTSVLDHHPLDDPPFQLKTDLCHASPLSREPGMPLSLQRNTTPSELTLLAAASFMPVDEVQPHHSVLLATVDTSQPSLPFSTPGPTAAFRSSSFKTSSPTPARHQRLDAFGTRSLSPIPATAKPEIRLDLSSRQPHFVRVHSRLTSHSPRSSSVERFLKHEDVHEPSTRDRLSSPPHNHTEDDLIDYETLGFTWKKFDRGDIILDASSSSPLRTGKSDSEDLFWGTPVVLEPDHATHTLLTPVIHPSGQSSSASPRLTGVSTPIHSPLKQPSHSLDHGAPYTTAGRPFAYIRRPREEPSLSTSRDRTARRDATIHAQTPVIRRLHPASNLSNPSDIEQHSNPRSRHDIAKSDGRVSGEHAPEVRDPAPVPRKPFAPAPGIYVSPLRDASDTSESGAERSQYVQLDSELVETHERNRIPAANTARMSEVMYTICAVTPFTM